jgi:hypothetical protein
VVGGWRKLHNEELHNLYASENIVRVVKSMRMRRAGHIARKGEVKMHRIFWLLNLKGRYHSEGIGVDGRIILEWILGK